MSEILALPGSVSASRYQLGSTPLDYAVERQQAGLVRTVSVGDGPISRTSRKDAGPQLEPSASWWMDFMLRGLLDPKDVRRPPLTVVDLFSSIGGLSLGAREAISALGRRSRLIAAVDLDREALEVIQRNNPSCMAVHRSMWDLVEYSLTVRGSNARYDRLPQLRGPLRDLRGSVDVVVAGPPCQGHSTLNNSSRGNDVRNLLYDSAIAAAIALGAGTVVIENVPAVTRDRYEVVPTAGSVLAQAGYAVTSGLLRTDELGWPQRRRRHFLLASRSGTPPDTAFLAAALAALPVSMQLVLSTPFDRRSSEPQILHTPARLSSENSERARYLYARELFDLPNSERPDCHKGGTTYKASYGRMHPDRPSPTITTGFMTPGRGRFLHPVEPRTLTPREGARLQGFPDAYSLDALKTPTRAQLAKWIGDAVPPPLGFAAVLGALAPLASHGLA